MLGPKLTPFLGLKLTHFLRSKISQKIDLKIDVSGGSQKGPKLIKNGPKRTLVIKNDRQTLPDHPGKMSKNAKSCTFTHFSTFWSKIDFSRGPKLSQKTTLFLDEKTT